ncbi:Stk1 family PASTA domain-containing Ser/Thr kinase [Cellulomonas sp. Leaf395]|uniref:Stk1 family PASTA domain-containing Ser/Thr kinase n=1 Tax=Cellulomonas sp. Leaf395 TaxID=1736362 RepID=UPI0006F8392A|nr:Stk1 family PASTA domain-containing Ser/Thr kinase [Cellulomonas sp. Leaf395]KQS97071.1 serine/threonine protein kinase [Cellulomonas sp. Leaf395]
MGATVTDPFVGRLVDSRYEVVSRIARGGMATVYLAVDRRLDRDVALKVMHAHLAEGTSGSDFVARFRREARTAARLTHPGLVGVFDQGVDGETSYLTMEYIDGCNLRRHIGERGALTVDDALRIGESVLDALAAAHRVGLVHRDIKPENVLLASDGRVKLADFGLARAVTEVTSTTTGTVLGTVAYLAPELVVRGVSDTRTDVYACGILLYEMLTGRQPFTGETPIQVAFQHVNNDVPAPSELVGWLPIEVDDAVRALAARDPDDRPVDAAAALALLRRTRAALDDETLARHADVDPSIVLPAATDPDETDLDAEVSADDADEPAEAQSAATDNDETTLIEAGDARGTTVALPIGLGVGVQVITAPPTEPPAKRHRARWFVLLAVLAALIGGATWWYLQVGAGAYTTVPTIIGQNEAEATAILERAGLGADPSSEFDGEASVGEVFATDPGQGDRIRKDGTVAFTISKGPDYVPFPEGVVGAVQADAEAALIAAGLEASYAEPRFSDSVGNAQIISATLPDGTPAEPGAPTIRGTDVRLTVSKGPEPVTITSVVGTTLEDATGQLEADNLKLAPTEVFSDTVAAGLIIDQDPVAGAEGHRGDTIAVNISKGPEMLALPSTYGQNVKAAEAALQAAGFVVKVEHPQGISPLNIVYSQKPAGGEGKTAPKGSTITINVF